jgi:hypothetical protein
MSMILIKSIVLELERFITPFVGLGEALNDDVEISEIPD